MDTPMMKQYKSIKASHPDAILFFRLGDFYEMFMDDAHTVSKELGITLTARGKNNKRIPMCGVPYHASESYVNTLINKGYKVAICEQIGTPSEKSIVERKVVRIITPGTNISDCLLQNNESQYLLSICPYKDHRYGASFIDISTGNFSVFLAKSQQELMHYINLLSPKELLYSEKDSTLAKNFNSITTTAVTMQSLERAIPLFCQYFDIHSLSSFGLSPYKEAIPAALSILDYVALTQQQRLDTIKKCQPFNLNHTLFIDKNTFQNLEIFSTAQSKGTIGSLLWVLDETNTSSGSRLLKNELHRPSYSKETLIQRYDIIDSILNKRIAHEELREHLTHIYDLERLLSKILLQRNNPKDCLQLKYALLTSFDFADSLSQFNHPALLNYSQTIKSMQNNEHSLCKLMDKLKQSIIPTPPSHIRESGFIQDGVDNDLDTLRKSFFDIKTWINTLEESERKRTTIKSLRLGYNKVFGYYFQIPHSATHLAPSNYIRKQTLSNAERYITPELKEKELILLSGKDKELEIEKKIFESLLAEISKNVEAIQYLAHCLSYVDFLQSLAFVSRKYHYVRPNIDILNEEISIQDLRHPVLDKKNASKVIANDILLSKKQRCLLITGPNMAGKSTLMKQVALCIIMSQIGCFVPAKQAKIALREHIFTRIGASDNLYEGQSTFMVEMTETSSILHNASNKSLVLLDEIGRGTATYDGISLASAILNYIVTQIRSLTLFATHYHELTQIASNLEGCTNYSMSIEEDNKQLLFTYKMIQGPADKSYGIHVAKMAGLPNAVTKQAELILQAYEKNKKT